MAGMSDKTQKKPAKKSKKKRNPVGVAVDATVSTASAAISGVFKTIGTVLLIIITTLLLFACVFAYYVKTALVPSIDLNLEEFTLSESSTIWYQDSDGQWRELVTLSGKENRKWVDYDDIPWYMEKALVSIEDKRFYDHKGVDWYRTSAAFVQLFGDSSFGGSTITQQLIKNLTKKDEVTVQRKLLEIFEALDLESRYDKKEIIEWYLNAVYFGEGCWGVQTAAETYFNKDVSDLSLAECAAIVGITNKPTYYDPFYSRENNKQRQENILWEMYDQGYIDYNTYLNAVNEELNFVQGVGEETPYKVFTYYEEAVINDVIEDLMEQKGLNKETARTLVYNGGYQIYCCLDPTIQSYVDALYQDTSNAPFCYGYSAQQVQSAIVIMDPFDGSIKALCGGVGEKNTNFELNRIYSKRPPGSSIKPISVYGPAVEYGLISPNTLVRDKEDSYLNGTSWYPHNDDWDYHGIVTVYEAITASLNTVSAQILDKLTPERSYEYLTTKLGVTSLVPDDCSYAPLSLGQLTNGITVREMAQAYGAFVNDGVFTYARTYSMVTDPDGNIVIDNEPESIQAFSPNTAYTMTYMMRSVVENGTGTGAYIGIQPVAGKTGTSGNSQDRWFVGCTPYYVAAVWTGYDTPETMNGFWGNPACQVFKTVMTQVHSELEYKYFNWPYIGGDTYIFGNLHEEKEDDERKAREAEEEEERRRQEEEERRRREEEEAQNAESGEQEP